jgi:hypothetical protein
MRQFIGTCTHGDDLIKEFVAAVSTAEERMWIDIHGIRLSASPEETKARDFTAQLVWTYYTLLLDPEMLDEKRQRDIYEKPWPNLVPEVIAEAQQLLAELEKLDKSNTKDVIGWTVRLGLATSCEWALSDDQFDSIANVLQSTKEPRRIRENDLTKTPTLKPNKLLEADKLLEEAAAAFDSQNLEPFQASWLNAARQWLTECSL